MSTTEATSSSPPSKSRLLSPEEADRIADSIRPSWEPPPPSVRVAAAAPVVPSVTVAEKRNADSLATTAPGTSDRASADRTLTNDEVRALEQRRRRSVPENSYREERSPSSPPERVEKQSPAESIILDPVVLAAPPPQFAASPRLPSDMRAAPVATLSADATVVIPPEDVDHLRPKRTGAFVGFGAIAALVAGGVYYASTQRGEPSPPPAATTQVMTPQTTAAPQEAALAPPPPAAPVVDTKPNASTAKADLPKKLGNNGGGRHEIPAIVPPVVPPKPTQAKPPATGGGDKGKLVRDVPF